MNSIDQKIAESIRRDLLDKLMIGLAPLGTTSTYADEPSSLSMDSIQKAADLIKSMPKVPDTRVYFSPFATEPTKEPARRHIKKRWMRESYHQRIQKKWVKRFGYRRKPAMFMTMAGLVAHPALKPQMINIASII